MAFSKSQEAKELIEITEQIEQLKKKKYVLEKTIKKDMESSGIAKVLITNETFIELVTDQRIIFKKNMKDKFIADMKIAGKTHLISVTVDINKDNLKTDFATGAISENQIKQYMNISEVKTLKVNVE